MNLEPLNLAGESITLEFKASFDKTTVESLVAFANAQGGTVLIGVTDTGSVCGVTVGKETLNEWLGQIKSATSPALIPDLVADTLHGKTVVAIRIGEFPVKPVNTRGRYFKRVASSNHQLSLGEIAGGVMATFAQREGINVGVNGLLSYIQSHPGKRAGEMAVAFKLTQRTIERWLKQLKENGLIAFRGAAKTGGYYYMDVYGLFIWATHNGRHRPTFWRVLRNSESYGERF